MGGRVLVLYPSLETSVSKRSVKRKLKSGEMKEYTYVEFYASIPKHKAEETMPERFIALGHKWLIVPREVMLALEEILKLMVSDLLSKKVSTVLDGEETKKIVHVLNIAAPVDLSALIVGNTEFLTIELFMKVNPDIKIDVAKAVRELEPLRIELLNLLKSNPLTRDVVGLDSEGDLVIATSVVATPSMLKDLDFGALMIKTYFHVKIEGEGGERKRIVITPIAIKITDWLEMVNLLIIAIDEMSARRVKVL